MSNPARTHRKPIVLITGISGNVGSSLSKALSADYHVVGMDVSEPSDGGGCRST
jgi:nucleoside-diphosphate-sugar epimerase